MTALQLVQPTEKLLKQISREIDRCDAAMASPKSDHDFVFHSSRKQAMLMVRHWLTTDNVEGLSS